MQNNKKTVIRINGEPITMREFKDFSLDVLVHCTAQGILEDGEDDAVLNCIHYVNDWLEEIAFEELTVGNFLIMQRVTTVNLGLSTDLFKCVDGHHLAEFNKTWVDLLFTDTLGSTFKETYNNLSAELYGGPFHPWF